jgi:hypothetical protein
MQTRTDHLFLAACLSTLAACQPAPMSSPPDATPPMPTAPTPPGTTTAPPPTGGGDLVGTWRSPSCGTRKYERRITFVADGAFTAEDLVSPCPPKVACVWSGIVNRKGRYALAGDTITFSNVEPAQAQGEPFPASLSLDPASKAPAERADGATCVYQR